MSSLGTVIKVLRQERGLSCQELGDAVRRRPTTIRRIEAGFILSPHPKTLRQIEIVLDLKPGILASLARRAIRPCRWCGQPMIGKQGKFYCGPEDTPGSCWRQRRNGRR